MLFCSMQFNYFVKLHMVMFGSLFHDDLWFLTKTAYHGFYVSALGRFLLPIVMMKIGFKKTYYGIIITQLIMSLTMSWAATNRYVYEFYILLTLLCDSGTGAIFVPFSA